MLLLPTGRIASVTLCGILTLIALAPAVQAQFAAPTASKKFGLSAFGGVTAVSPSYQPDTDAGGSKINTGLTVGGDLTRGLRWVQPSLELRYDWSTGSTVIEKTLSGGLKVEKVFGRLHPYGDVLLGYGIIDFQHPAIFSTGPYTQDNSFVYQGGGGLDLDLSPHFALKLDAQAQSWKLGSEGNRLTPVLGTVGVVYRIPFRALGARH